jgi:hypothetical protein
LFDHRLGEDFHLGANLNCSNLASAYDKSRCSYEWAMWNCFTEGGVTPPGLDSTKRVLKIEHALTGFDARIQFGGPAQREQIFRKAPSNRIA